MVLRRAKKKDVTSTLKEDGCAQENVQRVWCEVKTGVLKNLLHIFGKQLPCFSQNGVHVSKSPKYKKKLAAQKKSI